MVYEEVNMRDRLIFKNSEIHPSSEFLIIESQNVSNFPDVQGGSNMTGTDFYVNKPHCAAALRP